MYNSSPLQDIPLPTYPSLHVQEKLPIVLLQVACALHRLKVVEHSLISEKIDNFE